MDKNRAEQFRAGIERRISGKVAEGVLNRGDHVKIIEALRPCCMGESMIKAYEILYVNIDEKPKEKAKMTFKSYINTVVQISDIPGVRHIWGDHIDNELWHVVYVYEGEGYDVSLRHIDSMTLEIEQFIEAC